MSEVKRYDAGCIYAGDDEMVRNKYGDYVTYDDYAALQQKLDAVLAENVALKESRAILAENILEACNAIASAGFRHEAITRGFMESTGNRNKYPKPITTTVDEALRNLETPATDAILNEVRAEGAIAVRDTLVVAEEGADLYAIATQTAAQLRAGSTEGGV